MEEKNMKSINMGLEFFQTKIGKTYLEKTLPELIETNKRLADLKEREIKILEDMHKQSKKDYQLERDKLVFEGKKEGIDLKKLFKGL